LVTWAAARAGVAFAPGGNGGEIDWILEGPWGKLAVLIVVAVAVLTVGNLMMKRRARIGGAGSRARGDFDLEVAKMTDLPVTAIAQAKPGPVHVEAVLVSANGSLGGAPGRECVWRNRYGASRSTAVGAELVVAQDESGQAGLEGLEHARVLAPKDPTTGKHEFASLYVGDRVEILGYFTPEKYGDATDPTQRVYGMMGVDGHMQVKVLERPAPEAAATSPDDQADERADEPPNDPDAPDDERNPGDPA
jgi:hypothetical protein